MVKNITVIGGGSTGHAAAAIYSMKGFKVTLYDDESFAPRFEKIKEQGGIQLRGKVRGIGNVETITYDPEEAVKEADLICVHVMSSRHEEIAKKIAPFVKSGQYILIVPGNLGSFVFDRVFKEMGAQEGTVLIDQLGNLCPCRITGDAEVTVGVGLKPKRIACLKNSKTPEAIEDLKEVWEFIPAKNIFECSLNANNVIIHISTTVLSTTMIETMGDDFNLFKNGFTPATIRVAKLAHAERMKVIKALGFNEYADPIKNIEAIVDVENNPQLDVFRTLNGPEKINHRYLFEDCTCGAAITISFAKRLGIDVPVLETFVKAAGFLNGEDYLETGRTLENLGFAADMEVQEVLKAVE